MAATGCQFQARSATGGIGLSRYLGLMDHCTFRSVICGRAHDLRILHSHRGLSRSAMQ